MSDQKWDGEDWRDGMPPEAWEKVKPSAPPVDPEGPPSVAEAVPAPPLAEAVPVPTAPRRKRANFVLPGSQAADQSENLEIGAFVKTGYQKDGSDALHLYEHKKNKLRVVLAPKSSNNVCALSVCFLVGSKAETLGSR